MKKKNVFPLIVMLCFLLMTGSLADEAAPLASYVVRNGARQASFSYPEGCYIFDDGSLGVFVYHDAASYVAVSIPGRGMSGTEKLRENIGDDRKILTLSNDICVFAVHGDDNHQRPHADIVCVGVNLPDGMGILANADCPAGQTAIYDVLLCIVDSLTDAAVLQEWLENEWMPFVLADSSPGMHE